MLERLEQLIAGGRIVNEETVTLTFSITKTKHVPSVFSSLTIQSHDPTQCAPVTLNIRLSGLSSRLLRGHSFYLTIYKERGGVQKGG